MCEFHAHKFESFHLESLDDFSNKPPLNSIGLDGNEGAFLFRHDPEKQQDGLRETDTTNT